MLTQPKPYNLFKMHFINNPEDLEILKEKSFNELATFVFRAAEINDFQAAYQYSAALCYTYGLPGIIVTHHLNLKSLAARESEGEYLEAGVCDALTYLLLAEELFKTDPQAVGSIKTCLPEEDVFIPGYFTEQKNAILRFFPLSPELLDYCEQSAKSLALALR